MVAMAVGASNDDVYLGVAEVEALLDVAATWRWELVVMLVAGNRV